MKNQKIAQELIEVLGNKFQLPATVISIFVAGILAELTILLRGGTGTGKTEISKAVAQFFGNSAMDIADTCIEGSNSFRVQGTIGTQSSSFLGGLDVAELTQGKRKVVFRKFLAHPIRFLDEAGRLNPYVWADLASLLAEQSVTIEGETFNLPRKGVFLFTMNPPNPRDPANTDLPPFAYSRVDMKMSLPAPGVGGNRRIIKGASSAPVENRYSIKDLTAIWDEVKQVGLDLPAEIALATMVRSTTYCTKGGQSGDKNQVIEAGAFPAVCKECDYAKGTLGKVCSVCTPLDARALVSASQLAKALAYIDGRDTATEKDVLAAMPHVIEHRLHFPNQTVVNREEHAHSFVNAMYAASTDCITIARNPGRITEKRLAEIKQQKSPLLNEILDEFMEEIKAASAETRAKLGSMNTRELQQIRTAMSDADAKLVDQMLHARSTVMVKATTDLLNDPFFQQEFTSPEGEALFSPDQWESLQEDGVATGQLPGVTMVWDAEKVTVSFKDPAEADSFREKLKASEYTILPAYTKSLRDDLTKAGIIIPQPTPVAAKPVAVNAAMSTATAPSTVAQGKLF